MMLSRSIDALLAQLHALSPAEITTERLQELIGDRVADESSLWRFAQPKTGGTRYARNLVERSDLFDVICVVWEPGACTPIHDHAEQLGWVQLVRGAVKEETWREQPEGSVLEGTGDAVVADVGAVATVDTVRAIHRISNPSQTERAVTLHVYSRPHDACRVFGLGERQQPQRQQLRFDSVGGAPVEAVLPEQRAAPVEHDV